MWQLRRRLSLQRIDRSLSVRLCVYSEGLQFAYGWGKSVFNYSRIDSCVPNNSHWGVNSFLADVLKQAVNSVNEIQASTWVTLVASPLKKKKWKDFEVGCNICQKHAQDCVEQAAAPRFTAVILPPWPILSFKAWSREAHFHALSLNLFSKPYFLEPSCK